VDLGVAPIVVRNQHVVRRLKGVSYVQLAGNRFARGLSDILAGMKGDYPHDRTPMAALAAAQRLSAKAADRRFTRIRALIARVLGPI